MKSKTLSLTPYVYVKANVTYGRLVVEAIEGEVRLAFSPTQPQASEAAYHKIPNGIPISFDCIGEDLWVMSPEAGSQVIVSESREPCADYWAQHAIDVIYKTYGHTVTIKGKSKDLLKSGRTVQSGSAVSTVMILPPDIENESYVSTNAITTVSSANAADAHNLVIEGYTIDGSGNFALVTQTVILDGQTQVALATPLARSTDVYNNGSTELVGPIYVYETDTSTAGVPDTPSKVHIMIAQGRQQSEKAATTISNDDYWVVTGFSGTVVEKVATAADIRLEVREKGGVFRIRDYVASSDGNSQMK